ncbi:wsv058 [White spot syndrome virus]|uniref:Wsv058 n=3 Tax=White spot syndrome virus TaxID=342409 RepID=Q8VBB3_WSSVS|nr:wsv058 [Shrimp white spot syndrome virus]AAL33062.1 wsv058 [Shrimp white spot syndrome virus]AWQ60247.1 wsv058 [Shrimp white spot syndrome virus]AWQ60665.1 wsv058 [Shrimp white spot syndrome virus]AWQ61512.1 wsv058 [Shrimp white spot syndrome virus]AWQ61979.1 wsv058 [Shrimp white spot syndrome virus]
MATIVKSCPKTLFPKISLSPSMYWEKVQYGPQSLISSNQSFKKSLIKKDRQFDLIWKPMLSFFVFSSLLEGKKYANCVSASNAPHFPLWIRRFSIISLPELGSRPSKNRILGRVGTLPVKSMLAKRSAGSSKTEAIFLVVAAERGASSSVVTSKELTVLYID